jgi:hypothetical protein
MERKEIIVRVNGQSVLFDDLPALIPVPTAGEILGLTRATAYRYAATGGLPIRRFGGRRLYVVKAKLRELLEYGDEVAA